MSIAEPKTIQSLLNSDADAHLIDVRSPAEYRGTHVANSRNLPLDTLNPQAIQSLVDEGAAIIFICQSGARSAKATQLLQAAGFGRVQSLEGGINKLQETGFPLEQGKAVISLERQVRIAAGALVATGVALSLLVHPGFVALSAFVGLGLVFAGITNTCGMGMLLAKMPWNR